MIFHHGLYLFLCTELLRLIDTYVRVTLYYARTQIFQTHKITHKQIQLVIIHKQRLYENYIFEVKTLLKQMFLDISGKFITK